MLPRLSGDISEDPVFPKLKFPSKEFCSACYDGRVTGELNGDNQINAGDS